MSVVFDASALIAMLKGERGAAKVAGAIAEALGAEKLVYLTDIEGLRRDVDDAASLIRAREEKRRG